MRPTTVLLDLDGVIRHFDQQRVEIIEAAHGLEVGILHGVAFRHELLHQVVTGRIRRAEWVEEIGRRVGSPEAARDAFDDRGRVDHAMLDEVDGLRSRGVTVAILTNGTDTIPAEMAELGIDTRVDAVLNSAELGAAKPDRRVFEIACARLGVEPTEVFFTDDSESKLRGAIEIGMTARRFEGIDSFRRHLAEFGLSRV